MFIWIFSISVVHSRVVEFTTSTPTAFAIFTGIILVNLLLIVRYRYTITRKQFIADIQNFGATFLEIIITAFILSSLFVAYSSWYAKVAFILTGFVGVLLLERIKARVGK
jgi:hypothetical protein